MSLLRRHGTTIAIVALTAVAGVVVLVTDRGSVTTTERVTRKKNLITSFRDDDVSELVVTLSGRRGRVFRGPVDDAGQRPWRVEIDGVTWPAEEAVVDQLLASLRDGVVVRWVEGGVESPGEPRATLAVQMDRRRWLVTLRGPAPTPEGALYVEVQGGDEPRTGVITAQLAAALLAEPESLRQKALILAGAGDVSALSIDGEGGARHLVKAAWPAPRGGAFHFDGSTPEGRVRASAPALDKVWDGLGKLSAEAFLGDAEADRALDRKVTVKLDSKSAGKLTIDVGGGCPGHPDDVVAIRRDDRGGRVSACVPRLVIEQLGTPVSELVDRRLIGARAEEIIDLKLTSGGTTIAMARAGTQWRQQTPIDRVLDKDLGKAFVERLIEVSATRLVTGDPKALGLDPPRATVRVVSLAPGAGADGGDAERTEIVEIGAEQAGRVHVRRVEDGALGEITAAQAEALLPSDLALRPHQIHGEAFSSMRMIRVEAPGRVQRFERGADGSWSMIEPRVAGVMPDAGMLGELGAALGGLSAERWIGAARPEHGLDRPRLVVEALVEGGADAGAGKRPIRVAVGAPAEGAGSFARSGDDPAVFVVTKRIEEAADRWLVDRTALVTEVSRVRKVTIVAGAGKRAVLEASGGAFHVAGAAADPIASARAAAVREALGDLVSEGAITLGPAEKHQGFDKPALEVTIDVDKQPVKLRIGAGDTLKGTSVYYARREGIDATFAVAQARVRPLIEAAR